MDLTIDDSNRDTLTHTLANFKASKGNKQTNKQTNRSACENAQRYCDIVWAFPFCCVLIYYVESGLQQLTFCCWFGFSTTTARA